tara:strand:- start:45 stop:398 length:354 start_codon:yes stop_codon:yes gene_type:complete
MKSPLKKDDVNKVNTVTWVKCNDDAKSDRWRNMFVDIYGGEFEKNGLYWNWKQGIVPKIPKKEPNRRFKVTTPDNQTIYVENVNNFCKKNKLNKSAFYAVVKGQRSHHKGYKVEKEN